MTSGLTDLACFTSVNFSFYFIQNAAKDHFAWTMKLNLESSLKSHVPESTCTSQLWLMSMLIL